MTLKDVFFVFFVSALVVPQCLAICYFPDYLQGEFSVQSSNSLPGQIKYNSVSISAEAVSLWGFCNKKIGNGLYLIDSFNGTYCLRCFHISVKSQNIVVVRLAGHTDRCFVSSQAAESSCPKLDQLETARQVILFKTKEEIRKEHCPINGRYSIQYRQNKPDYPIECTSRSSQLDNCPVGSEINIRFRDCHFENHDFVFECLGSWEGPHQQRYLALFDTRTGTDPRPQYRCGLYREDPGSGTVYIAFSSDSTCITDLHNSQSGFETLVLTKIPPRYPLQLAADHGCRFPSWTEGRWELVNVQGKIFTYTDSTIFKKYTFQCIENDDARGRNFASPVEERILVVGRTECNEEIHTCVWLKKRGENVFEFQLATETSQYPNTSLCSDQNFRTNVWITQGRKDVSTVSPCPILGEYIGNLPNAENLCAKLSSDCVSQDTMYYMVSDCSQQQIFEGWHSRPQYPYRQIRQVNQNEDQTPDKNIASIETTPPPPTPDTISNHTTVTPVTTTPISMPNSTTTTADSIKANITEPNTSSTGSSAVPTETTTKPIKPPASAPAPAMEPSASAAETSQRVIANDNNYQTSSEISVGSYYAENRNFGELPRDIRLLPAPISSSTISPYVPYRRTYPAPAPITPNDYQYEQPPGARYTQYTNYRDDRRYQNDYYQRTDYRSYPPASSWNQSFQTPQANQMNQPYLMDPTNSYRPPVSQNVYALPPIQLPPAQSTYRPIYPSRRQSNVPFFKEREYRCLGQWQENNVTYTFTQRKDIGTYECFVGTTISEYDISVREAGKYCERNMNPLMPAMKLSLKNACAEKHSSTAVFSSTTQTIPVPVTTTKYTANRRLQHTTRPWRPLNVTNRPPPSFRNKNSSPNDSTKIVPSHLFLLFILHVISFRSFFIAFTNF